LDYSNGEALMPIPRNAGLELSMSVRNHATAEWELDDVEHRLSLDWESALSSCNRCHEEFGVWPISFSYPREPHPLTHRPEVLVSLVTPGLPYSFDNEQDYLEAYARAYWVVTYRKAGRYCFRHVEIFGSGAVPLMIDASEIPRFSMVHYPKQAMAEAMREFSRYPRRPDGPTRKAFREFLNQHLTSKAMAEYVLEMAGLSEARRVLFVDQRLPHHADYQSVLTLLGLKQLLGHDCTVMYPVDYVYEDTSVDTSALYGRGFGYTRVLPASLRSDAERVRHRREDATMDEVDAVVIGSVSRNEGLAAELLRRFPADRTVWIHGEDSPPRVEDVVRYRRSGAHVFVRAIHSKG